MVHVCQAHSNGKGFWQTYSLVVLPWHQGKTDFLISAINAIMHCDGNVDYNLFSTKKKKLFHVDKTVHYLCLSVLFCSQGYMKPLKHPENSPLCDPSLVDEMFYQIPEILEHHEQFLEQVLDCVNQWHDKQTIGHVLIQSVRS